MYLKKISDDWTPSENKNLKVGEIIEFNAPYEALVKQGKAILVDELGNEMELPGQELTCPICFNTTNELQKFMEHVGSHYKKKQENLEQQLNKLQEEKKAEEPIVKKTTNTKKK